MGNEVPRAAPLSPQEGESTLYDKRPYLPTTVLTNKPLHAVLLYPDLPMLLARDALVFSLATSNVPGIADS